MLAAIREILHNDDNCMPFFQPFCIHFEKILHAVVLKTSLYEIETCIILCDLIEEFLSSLVLNDANSKKHIIIQKENSIDWNFWIIVVQRLLSGENVNTILRALAFLFNIWNYIPVGSVDDGCRTSHEMSRKSSESKESTMFHIFDCPEGGLRWIFTTWLLSPQLWKTYFCHWNPMVRAYYQRLVCWRVASVGCESNLISSILYANYNSDARTLLEKRLGYSCSRFSEMNLAAKNKGLALASAKPSCPALNRRLIVTFNPACLQTKPMSMNFMAEGYLTPVGPPILNNSNAVSTRRIDPYEVFDDIAYSFPTVPVSSGMVSSENINGNFSKKNKSSSTSAIESIGNMIKKKWSLIRGDKRNASKSSLENRVNFSSVKEYAPSLTSSSSTMSSSFIRTPGSGSLYSDARSPGSILSLTSYMNCEDDASIQSMPLVGGSPTSLTMSLIPPPPQILRKRPEIVRPMYRFSLEFSEQDFEQQHKSAADRARAKRTTTSIVSPVSCDKDVVAVTPLRLPFGEQFTDDVSSDSDSDCEESEDNRTARREFEYVQLRARERTRHKAADDHKYWQYAGRALNEWAGVVTEFEEYVAKCRMETGIIRVEELAAPFMVAEIQVKSVYV